MFEGGSAGKVAARERGDRSAARRPYWLIRRPRGAYIEALTVEFGGVEALPVFSFEEEAELFLSLGVVSGEEGWVVWRSGAGEILSLLHGLCSGADGVALDPVPECCGGSLMKLLVIEREEFENSVLGSNPVLDFFSKTSLPA
ncbi:MAG: hypothetical protein M3494_01040 [Actinomycetota bacterium]|jgi:hypothetical protein|nr:hypothetical protein [Rubrobacter sp.]MDQ3506596.1 hypothetical protein [Actinomycetota bacterium]